MLNSLPFKTYSAATYPLRYIVEDSTKVSKEIYSTSEYVAAAWMSSQGTIIAHVAGFEKSKVIMTLQSLDILCPFRTSEVPPAKAMAEISTISDGWDGPDEFDMDEFLDENPGIRRATNKTPLLQRDKEKEAEKERKQNEVAVLVIYHMGKVLLDPTGRLLEMQWTGTKDDDKTLQKLVLATFNKWYTPAFEKSIKYQVGNRLVVRLEEPNLYMHMVVLSNKVQNSLPSSQLCAIEILNNLPTLKRTTYSANYTDLVYEKTNFWTVRFYRTSTKEMLEISRDEEQLHWVEGINLDSCCQKLAEIEINAKMRSFCVSCMQDYKSNGSQIIKGKDRVGPFLSSSCLFVIELSDTQMRAFNGIEELSVKLREHDRLIDRFFTNERIVKVCIDSTVARYKFPGSASVWDLFGARDKFMFVKERDLVGIYGKFASLFLSSLPPLTNPRSIEDIIIKSAT